MKLNDFGWTPTLETTFAPHADRGLTPGRLLRTATDRALVLLAEGERETTIAGRLRHRPPVVGDWVAIRLPEPTTDALAVIEAFLPRHTTLSRKVAGARSREQVVAANVETVLIVMGLDGDFNLRRLERLLTMVWESGAQPVVVLNKLDLASDLDDRRRATEAAAPGVDVHAVCSLDGRGLAEVARHLVAGRTLALIGSSGVGKSSLLNALAGSTRQRTGVVRARDDRGRHTTTHRELFRLPSGALVIDNPGIRELQLWSQDGEGLERTFSDIESLAGACRFRDCRHRHEPGCAVQAAVEDGRLSAQRLASLHALEDETAAEARRRDTAAHRQHERAWAAVYKEAMRQKSRRFS